MKAKEFTEACWTGYRQQGTKRKGDRTVPNCVPVEENLRDWFGKGKEGGAGGGGWDRYNTKGERIGKCGDSKPGEGKPKCLSKSRAASLRASGGKAAIAAAVRRKRAKDPNPERRGAAKMVPNRPKKNESLQEDPAKGDIPAAVTKFYQDEVGDFSTKPVGNYKEVARALVQQAPTPTIRRKVVDALVAAKDNPYIQGGVITTIGAALAGGVLTSAQQMGLNPGQTNVMLQAILNTVIPTVVSVVNGKSLKDTIKYVLTSAAVGTGYAAIAEAGKDACYHKVKSRYKVWPSAYASGALVRCRKVGAANWGNKSKK